MKTVLSLSLIAMSLLAANVAGAWDCTYWSQSTNPTAECYKAPTGNSNANTNTNGQGQTQGQGQTATGGKAVSGSNANSSSKSAGGSVSGSGNSTATGGRIEDSGNSKSSSVANGGAGGSGGSGGTGGRASSNSTQGNTQVSQNYVQASAPNLGLPTQIIAGCGVAMSAGGSTVRGAAMLGFGFTTAECYAYIEAQAYWAIGDRYDACQVLHTTNAAKRSESRGAKFADCQLPSPEVIEKIVEVGPSEADIQLRIQHAIAEYINDHPEKPCPKPKHGKVKHYEPCKMPKAEVKTERRFGIDWDFETTHPPQ